MNTLQIAFNFYFALLISLTSNSKSRQHGYRWWYSKPNDGTHSQKQMPKNTGFELQDEGGKDIRGLQTAPTPYHVFIMINFRKSSGLFCRSYLTDYIDSTDS